MYFLVGSNLNLKVNLNYNFCENNNIHAANEREPLRKDYNIVSVFLSGQGGLILPPCLVLSCPSYE